MAKDKIMDLSKSKLGKICVGIYGKPYIFRIYGTVIVYTFECNVIVCSILVPTVLE